MPTACVKEKNKAKNIEYISQNCFFVENSFGCAGASNEKQPTPNPEIGSTSQEVRKRKRFAFDGGDDETSMQNQLVDVFERNGKLLAAHLDAQNSHFQLDREQRKDHTDSVVAVLNKLADALVRIAEKL